MFLYIYIYIHTYFYTSLSLSLNNIYIHICYNVQIRNAIFNRIISHIQVYTQTHCIAVQVTHVDIVAMPHVYTAH